MTSWKNSSIFWRTPLILYGFVPYSVGYPKITILMGKLMTSYCNGFCGIGVPYFQTAPYRLFHNGTEHVGSNMEK